MSPQPVVFIDSGVGGLPYFDAFRKLASDRYAVYIADREQYPYGPKKKEELSAILISLVDHIRRELDPCLFVIACNSASVSALDALRVNFPDLPFVGTVPAVKPAALYSRTRQIGVLATERTVEDPYVRLLAERFAPDCELIGMAAPELVEFVEHRYIQATPQERSEAVAGYVRKFRELHVDALVLGCTHFLFLAPEFAVAAAPDMVLFDSRSGVAKRAIALLEELPTMPKAKTTPGRASAQGAPRMYVTGDAPLETQWSAFASHFGLELSAKPGIRA